MHVRVVLLLLIGIGGSVSMAMAAPATTLPAEPDVPAAAPRDAYQDLVDQFAHAMIDAEHPQALRAMLAGGASVRAFGRQIDEPERFERFVGGATLIGAHAYADAPATVASDLANDLGGAEVPVPDDAKRRMSVEEGKAGRANAIARQWVQNTLDLPDGRPSAVIVLWRPRQSSQDHASGMLVFVLVKIESSPTGSAHIRKVVFGEPLDRND